MEKVLRVLHVFGSLDRGGAETMIMNLYRKIDRNKIQFDFIVHGNEIGAYEKEIESYGGKVYHLSKYKGTNHFTYIKEWKNFLEKHKEYEIIHSHMRSTASIYLAIAKKMNRTGIIHSHSTSSGKGFVALVKDILQLRLRFISDYFFACSSEAGKWLFGKKVCQRENFFLIKNAVDAEKFSYCEETRVKMRKKLGLEHNIIIGHIGRFIPVKNHEFIIDIFQRILQILPEARLMLVGEGSLETIIQDKVNNLGLSDKVLFTGVRTDIANLLQAMDLLVMPSLFEGLPVVLIESQAAGLPTLISTQISDEVKITNLVENLSLEDSPNEWAQKSVAMMEKLKRRNTYQELFEAGYDMPSVARWYEEFLGDKQ